MSAFDFEGNDWDDITEWEKRAIVQRLWDERAEPGALREALDVERLARAITMHSVAQRVNGPDAYLGHKCMGDCAVHIAREYAALSREEATSE